MPNCSCEDHFPRYRPATAEEIVTDEAIDIAAAVFMYWRGRGSPAQKAMKAALYEAFEEAYAEAQ